MEIRKDSEYGGYVRNLLSGEYDRMFTAAFDSALVARGRAREKAEAANTYRGCQYDINDIIVKRRETITIFGGWEMPNHTDCDASYLCHLFNDCGDNEALLYALSFCVNRVRAQGMDLFHANQRYIDGNEVAMTSIASEEEYHEKKRDFFRLFGVSFDDGGDMHPVRMKGGNPDA